MDDELISTLGDLGFSGLEARVYVELLRCSPQTAYGVAKQCQANKPNVYKALESLYGKGAVLLQEEEKRVWRAVPYAELLPAMAARYQSRADRAAEMLAEVSSPPSDPLVYELQSIDAIWSRAQSMLAACKKIAIIEGFPGPLAKLAPDIDAAAARGVRVGVRAHDEEVLFEHATVFPSEDGAGTLASLRGAWLALTTDSAELLVAYFDRSMQRVHQALTSSSPILALLLTDSLGSEMVLGALLRRAKDDPSRSDEILRQAADDHARLSSRGSRGRNALLK